MSDEDTSRRRAALRALHAAGVRGSSLLTTVRGPSTVTAEGFEKRLAELTDEPVPDTDELRNRALRRGLTRRLLEDPVVYYDDLDDAERAYLVSQRAAAPAGSRRRRGSSPRCGPRASRWPTRTTN